MALHGGDRALDQRLRLVDLEEREPMRLCVPIPPPLIVTGLPRSGTSILFELLSQDPEVGVPLMWEALQPCPPPQAATAEVSAGSGYRLARRASARTPSERPQRAAGGHSPIHSAASTRASGNALPRP